MTDLERQERLAKRQQELSERYSREDNIRENEDVKAVLSTEAGRRVFASIIGRGYVFSTVYKATNDNPTRLAYETGRREYATDLYRRANAIAPELVLKAICERNEVNIARRNSFDDLEKEYEKEN